MALWLWRVGIRFCWWCFTRFCNKWSIWIYNITVSSEIHGPIVKFPENISIGKIMPHGMCKPLFWYLTLTYISRLQIPFLKIHELIKCISDVDFFFVEMLSWLWNEIKIKVLKKHRTKQKKANKVHIFWEGHKNFAKSPPFFDWYYIQSKKGGDFAKFLWPSQNIWTLLNVTKNCKFSDSTLLT